MMRAIGFLSGVCLTVAAVLLALGSRESPPPQTVAQAPSASTAEELTVRDPSPTVAEGVSAQTPSAPTPEEPAVEAPAPPKPQELSAPAPPPPTPEALAKMVAAIAEHVDITPEANESEQAVAPQPQAATAGGDTQSAVEASAPAPAPQPDVQTTTAAGAFDGQDHDQPGTYLFWSPFRSEWAAQGFARRLTSATQVPVEVIAAAPGAYRVAFSYQDERQRQAWIDRIQTITGLQLE
jgi:hypothetical protein